MPRWNMASQLVEASGASCVLGFRDWEGLGGLGVKVWRSRVGSARIGAVRAAGR